MSPASLPARLRACLLALALGPLSLPLLAADAQTPSPPVLNQETAGLRAFSYDQRADFQTAVRTATTELDAKITALNKRRKGGVGGGAGGAAMDDLQAARTELGHRLGRLDEATAETWNELRDAVVTALNAARVAYAEADRA